MIAVFPPLLSAEAGGIFLTCMTTLLLPATGLTVLTEGVGSSGQYTVMGMTSGTRSLIQTFHDTLSLVLSTTTEIIVKHIICWCFKIRTAQFVKKYHEHTFLRDIVLNVMACPVPGIHKYKYIWSVQWSKPKEEGHPFFFFFFFSPN